MTVGKQFEKNFAMICFLLSPSGGKRKTHFSLQNSERPFCLPTVTPSPPVSAIMALNIMYRQKKTDGNRPRLPSVSVTFLYILHNPLFMIRVVGLCNMLKLTIFQRKSQNIIDIYTVSLFSILPVNLYSLSVSLQSSFGSALSGITDAESIGMTAQQVLMSAAMPGVGNPILQIFCAVMMGYAVIKVFFGNLKRGGILLIQIAVGSLYMFSVPRGYIDGFTQWCKQVIGICLTAFLQSTMLTAGLMIFKDHPLLGLGVMLSSTEVPRIAGQFGLDTSTKANLMSGVYAAQTAINISKTVVKAVAA